MGTDPGRRSLVPAMACISVAAACLVGGYEFVRSTAASLYIEAFGAASMPYAMTMIPVLMGVLIYAYGFALSRLGSLKTLQLSLAFSAAVFLLSYFAVKAGLRYAVAGLYVFAEVYIVILVEQFWSFINSRLLQSEAKIYNGPILGGASVGPIAAGMFLKVYATRLGSEQFILLAGAALVPTAALSFAAYRLAGEPQPAEAERGDLSGPLNLRLILNTRVLVLIACVVGLAQVFATVMNLRFYEILEGAMPLKDQRSAYLGSFWASVNGTAFVLQFFLAPLLLKRLPLAALLLGIPALHIATSATVLLHPALWTAAMSLLLFKAVDYSLFRASKELLYIPLTYEARYRAKQVVDAFTYRFSKGATAGAISLAKSCAGALPGWVLASTGLAAAAAWLVVSVPLSRTPQMPKEADLMR